MSIHGDSYLFHIKKRENCLNYINEKIFTRLESEIKSNIYSIDTYINYKNNVILWKNNLIQILKNNQDKIIICAGCSAKGVVILQYLYNDIKDNIKIECIDENNLKINKMIDSVNIKIHSFDFISSIDSSKSILFMLTAWNFKNEIKNKISLIRPNNNYYLNLFPLYIE
jgi:hypothetical protein